MTFLTLSAVSKRYGNTTALDRVDLSVRERSKTAVVGPSGSGKTTLLRLLAGFDAPDSGSIVAEGRTFADDSVFVPPHRRNIGIVAQEGALFPHLSVSENIAFGLDGRHDVGSRILALLDMVELDRGIIDRRPHELSGGQQQRVALARALARQPRLMLLDEPFSALDAGLRESTRRSVGSVLGEAGITTILVTHDQVEALSFADQVAVLRGGRLIQSGTPKDVYLRPVDRETAAFLGDAVLLPARIANGSVDCVLGRIPACAASECELGEIMLRPEQLRFLPISSAGHSDVCQGRVVSVEFGGTFCRVTVKTTKPASVVSGQAKAGIGDSQIISVTMSSGDAPDRGTDVAISVVGQAHVFVPFGPVDRT
jgi:iron(III) transport system ATP-binding protein